jgi:CheY-like chemotaxis protein
MKILVADDEAFIIDLLEDYLTMGGHTVTSAFDAKAMVARAAENPPDIIFMDINMPGIRDESRTPQIQIPPALANIPIVAVTGSEIKRLREQGLPENIPVLVKPIEFPDMDAILAKITPKA